MRRKKAFTLVELLVVISIIALLLSILLPALNKAKEHAKIAVCLSNMKQVGYAFKVYMQDNEYRFPYEEESNEGVDYFWAGDAEFAYGGDKQNLGEMLAKTPDPEHRLLYPYAKDFDVFFCPSDKGENLLPMEWWKPTTFFAMGSSYRYNYNPWNSPLLLGNSNGEGGLAAVYGLAGQKDNWVPHPSRYILLHEPPALKWYWYDGRWFLWHFARGESTVADPRDARSAFISNILFVDGHTATLDFTDSLIDPITGGVNEYICESTAEWVWYKPGEEPTWGFIPVAHRIAAGL